MTKREEVEQKIAEYKAKQQAILEDLERYKNAEENHTVAILEIGRERKRLREDRPRSALFSGLFAASAVAAGLYGNFALMGVTITLGLASAGSYAYAHYRDRKLAKRADKLSEIYTKLGMAKVFLESEHDFVARKTNELEDILKQGLSEEQLAERLREIENAIEVGTQKNEPILTQEQEEIVTELNKRYSTLSSLSSTSSEKENSEEREEQTEDTIEK